jgi:tetratricopeptide (TPR) repeat protein
MTSAVLLWLALQVPSAEVVDHVRAGMEARRQGNVTEEIAEFKKVTELQPQQAAAFVNLGSAYMESHDYAAAIAPLRRALDLDANLLGAHQMLGYALLAQGYAAEAIPHFERSQSFDGLGIAQLETGKIPEAVCSLEMALGKRPGDPDLLYYLQRASGLLSKQVLDNLTSAYPDSARTHEALAESDAMLRRIPEAEKEFRDVLRLRPGLPGVQLALGELYAGASQWEAAAAAFRAETQLRPGDAEAAYNLGMALLQLGKVHEARLELVRADSLRKEMPETLYALGKAALLDGDEVLAENAWSKLLSIEDQGELAAQTHFGLAGLYRRQGKVAAATREIDSFKKLTKRSQ